MNSEKISPPLARSMNTVEGEHWFDVVVELSPSRVPEAPGSSRADKIANLKESFDRQAAPVTEQIRRMGGEVTGMAWINRSIRARIARQMIPALTDQGQVSRLDLPHAITAD